MAARTRFPALLRSRMDVLGHSQQEAARWLTARAYEVGVSGLHATTSQPALANMLSGRAKPHRCKWAVMADYLGVTLDELEQALDPGAPFPASRIPWDIGARIKQARVDRDLDRSEFETMSAQRLGRARVITAGVIAAYEDGYRLPDPRRVADIAATLDMPVERLLTGVEVSA